MNSRYDYMTESSVMDEEIGSNYPDPLSLNYLDFKMSGLPNKRTLSSSNICFFWVLAEKYYSKAQYDDLVLTLNGVSHKNFLRPLDVIYFPNEEDFNSSFSKSLT